jgi:hypothetical protein
MLEHYLDYYILYLAMSVRELRAAFQKSVFITRRYGCNV